MRSLVHSIKLRKQLGLLSNAYQHLGASIELPRAVRGSDGPAEVSWTCYEQGRIPSRLQCKLHPSMSRPYIHLFVGGSCTASASLKQQLAWSCQCLSLQHQPARASHQERHDAGQPATVKSGAKSHLGLTCRGSQAQSGYKQRGPHLHATHFYCVSAISAEPCWPTPTHWQPPTPRQPPTPCSPRQQHASLGDLASTGRLSAPTRIHGCYSGRPRQQSAAPHSAAHSSLFHDGWH